MADPDISDIQRRMDGALTALKTEFTGLRTGRASVSPGRLAMPWLI